MCAVSLPSRVHVAVEYSTHLPKRMLLEEAWTLACSISLCCLMLCSSTCAGLQVEKMCDVIKEIEKTYASASQLEELRKMVDGKADSSTLDNVAGGSSQAMEDVESKIKQLEQLYSEQAADVKAANDALLNKVDAGDVAALSSAMREQQSSSVPSASITQLQEALDSAVAQLEGQKQQLESIQVCSRLFPPHPYPHPEYQFHELTMHHKPCIQLNRHLASSNDHSNQSTLSVVGHQKSSLFLWSFTVATFLWGFSLLHQLCNIAGDD